MSQHEHTCRIFAKIKKKKRNLLQQGGRTIQALFNSHKKSKSFQDFPLHRILRHMH
jgi:hypothetical protein